MQYDTIVSGVFEYPSFYRVQLPMIGLPLNHSLKVFSAFILEEKRIMSNFNKLPHGIFLNFEFKRQV